jgi:glycosyltransferase involved in cell wall biosynthesis
MLTIFQITPAYKSATVYGGPSMSVSKLCEVLNTSKTRITVLTTTANGKKELNVRTNSLNKVEDVAVYYFKRYTKDHTHFSPGLLLHLIKEIKELKKNDIEQPVVHIHSWWNTVALLSALTALWYKAPVVVSPRGMLTPYSLYNRHSCFKSIIHECMGKHLLKHCYVHATTDKEKEDISKTIKSVKGIFIIPNFVVLAKNPFTIKPIQKDKNNNINLLFLSRIEEKKGLDILIKALAMTNLKWQLTVAGDGEVHYINQLKQLSRLLDIGNNINWIGSVNHLNKFDMMKENDLFILPSHNENFGNVVIECLSVGTPVIVSTEVGLASFVKEHLLGWVTTILPHQLSLTIKEAATDHKKREWIRKEGPSIIEKQFSNEDLLTKYTCMYQQIANHVN